jgi:chromate transport protein ChrA
MSFDIIGALTGRDIMLSIALVILIVLFIWIYSWGKNQLGTKLGLLIAIIIVYLTFFSFPELIWIILIFFILSTFGKELLERIPKK